MCYCRQSNLIYNQVVKILRIKLKWVDFDLMIFAVLHGNYPRKHEINLL